MTGSAIHPKRVCHADWGKKPSKRWFSQAEWRDGRYTAFQPEPVGDTEAFLLRALSEARAGESVVLGFDFVIGLPASYCRRAHIDDFLELLPDLGQPGRWERFYDVAAEERQIGCHRPFYPQRCQRRGEVCKEHLLRRLNLTEKDLLRGCEDLQPAAGALFWTIGGKQVGKGAIAGWQELLVPALKCPEFKIWPFAGCFSDLVRRGTAVVVETYPADMYRSLGLQRVGHAGRNSKKNPEVRREEGPRLVAWAERRHVVLSKELRREIDDGFGESRNGEDRFDAVVGLFGMLEVVLGYRCPYDPPKGPFTRVEGWMLGRKPHPQ